MGGLSYPEGPARTGFSQNGQAARVFPHQSTTFYTVL
jgi:hypothetical protein